MTEKISPYSNIFLFSGEDDFSLRRKIDFWKTEFAKKYSSQAVTIIEAGELSETQIIQSLQTHLSPSLFASKKLIIIRDGLPSKATQTALAEFLLGVLDAVPKDFFVIFWQSQKLDGRLGFSKKFTAKVTVNEFVLPHGLVLNQWISAMVKTMGSTITDRAVDKLAQFLGRDLFEEKKAGGRVIERREAFDLWQVYSEIQKLSAGGGQINVADVEALVRPKLPDSVFALTDEVVARHQRGAFQALENFLANQTGEEKTSLIKIIALLSEQIRSLLVMALLQGEGLNHDQIAEKLGWSAGRVFITAKNTRNISPGKLKQLLANLLSIDSRLKATDTNNKLDIDLFLATATG